MLDKGAIPSATAHQHEDGEMPWDMTPTEPQIIPAEQRKFGNEKLAQLEALLRTDFGRTGSFHWEFNTTHARTDCGTVGCAMGLGYEAQLTSGPFTHDAARDFEIPHEVARAIFDPGVLENGEYEWVGLAGYGEGVFWKDVTPIMVADAIRSYILTGEAFPS